ncbi:MAG: glycosyltransferase family 39 protein [Candidatus Hydrogenedentes bacterium]|nr:glycosyltransferase family 39 protein [Candidatus Hydrogenedentota bacterium]
MNDPTRASAGPHPGPADPSSLDPDRRASPTGRTGLGARGWRYAVHESIALPLLAIVLLTVSVVSPRGDFPLNDDWVYTKSVQLLLEMGNTSGHPFAAASTIAQVLWGALFCKLFGFGFTTLRVSTLVLSYAGMWAAARSALALGLTRGPAILCGALVFVSPLVLSLSYTFMSDVPFLAFAALSGLFYLRALGKPTVALVFWGSVFGVLSCLTRQFGVMIPAACGAVAALSIVQRRYRVTGPMLATFFGVWTAGAVILLYLQITKEPGLVIPAGPVPASWALRVLYTFRYAATAVCYLGFFFAPLAPAALGAMLCRHGRWNTGRLAALVFTCLAITALLWSDGPRRLPELGIGNMLFDLGVGPMTLSDSYLGYSWMPVRIVTAWWPIMIAAVLTAGLLVLCAVDTALDAVRASRLDDRAAAHSRQKLFLLLWGAAMLACPWNPWLPKAFDRYFVAAVVPLALLLGQAALRCYSTRAIGAAVLGGALMYVFSVASLHDYLGWNQARWAVIRELQEKLQVPPDKIDGGFEYNGMYTSDEFMRLHHTRNFFDSSAGAGGYWVMDNEYVIGVFEPRPGYEVILREPYFAWIGWRQCEVRAFHRALAPPAKQEKLTTILSF